MDLRYTVCDPQYTEPILYDASDVCTISSQNVIAYSRQFTCQDNFKNHIPLYSVCISDLNLPYKMHMIAKYLSSVKELCFSKDGTLLIVILNIGAVRLLKMGRSIDQWKEVYNCIRNGENILHANFFHTGMKTFIPSVDVKAGALYNEKFCMSNHRASLYDVGGNPLNGFYIVTSTGIVLVNVINFKGEVTHETKVVLAQPCTTFSIVTSAHAPDGTIHLAVCMSEVVQIWQLELRLVKRSSTSRENSGQFPNLDVCLESLPSFYPKCSFLSWRRNLYSKNVSCLKFMDTEDPTSLIVALGPVHCGDDCSQPLDDPKMTEQSSKMYFLQLYHLKEQTYSGMKLFVDQERTGAASCVKEWILVSEWPSKERILVVNAAPLPLITNCPFPSLICTITADSTLTFFHRDTLQKAGHFSIGTTHPAGEEPPLAKRPYTKKQFTCVCFSWSGLSLVALDYTGSLYFFTLANCSHSWMMALMLLLEYAGLKGNDWLDLLLFLPNSAVGSLSDRLSETFMQHQQSFTKLQKCKFFMLKNSIVRLCNGLQSKATEIQIQTHLEMMLQSFRNIRPITKESRSNDKNPLVALSVFLENVISSDMSDLDKTVDQFCFSVNPLDCQPDPTTSRELQNMLQFIADLSLFILFCLAQNSKYDLAKDPKIMNLLREALVWGRIWHRHNKLVYPSIVCKTDSVDIWAHVYKLLTKVAQALPSEPDSSTLDECGLLETIVICRDVPLHIQTRGFLRDVSLQPSCGPLQYSFDMDEVKPSHKSSSYRSLGCQMLEVPPHYDCFLLHYIANSRSAMHCSRCWAMKGGWLNEFERDLLPRCFCSGYWILGPPVTATKAA